MPNLILMGNLVADDRGRVTLPPAMRKHHGNEFIAIDMPDGIHLLPVPKGPLKLRGKPMSVAEQKRVALEEMEKEVKDELRTIHGYKHGWKR